MNGDEDLGEDITMKGDHFHYVQKDENPLPSITAANPSNYIDPQGPDEAPKKNSTKQTDTQIGDSPLGSTVAAGPWNMGIAPES